MTWETGLLVLTTSNTSSGVLWIAVPARAEDKINGKASSKNFEIEFNLNVITSAGNVHKPDFECATGQFASQFLYVENARGAGVGTIREIPALRAALRDAGALG